MEARVFTLVLNENRSVRRFRCVKQPDAIVSKDNDKSPLGTHQTRDRASSAVVVATMRNTKIMEKSEKQRLKKWMYVADSLQVRFDRRLLAFSCWMNNSLTVCDSSVCCFSLKHGHYSVLVPGRHYLSSPSTLKMIVSNWKATDWRSCSTVCDQARQVSVHEA